VRRFTRAEVERLHDGILIESMDDHWGSVMHGRRAVDFYRSWTGLQIYRLSLFQLKDGGALSVCAWHSLGDPRSAFFALLLAPLHPLLLRHLIRSAVSGKPSG
jgi:hypothetical protein